MEKKIRVKLARDDKNSNYKVSLKNIKKEKHYKNLITLHSSYHHCDLEELREKLDNAKLNIENIWVSQKEDNNFIELDDCES